MNVAEYEPKIFKLSFSEGLGTLILEIFIIFFLGPETLGHSIPLFHVYYLLISNPTIFLIQFGFNLHM